MENPTGLPRLKSRGCDGNPHPRFDPLVREAEQDGWPRPDQEDEPSPLTTIVHEDRARTIITRNQSPDIPFDRSVNPYRGCEHGCIYCFARPSHAYLGLSPGLDFESRLFAKPDAPALLEKELRHPRYRPAPMAFGTNTDPYQPIERERHIMRGCLQVLSAFNHPLTITTKSHLVTRDLDLLAPMARRNLVAVGISLTTLDRDLCRKLEPRAAVPAMRLDAMRRLSQAGVPVAAMIAPVIPRVTDHELEDLLSAAQEAGATSATYILLRLPLEVEDLMARWLQRHFPDRARHVMSLVSQSHGGKAYDFRWQGRFTGRGQHADLLLQRFRLAARKLGLRQNERVELDCSRFQPPPRPGDQMSLF